ncbi:hypothetical protein LCGC14_1972670, partial [marine sediment metagenome]
VVRAMRRSKRAKGLEHRLGLSDSPDGQTRELRLWQEGQEATTTVPVTRLKASLTRRVDQLRRDAGWEAPVPTLLLGLAGTIGLAVATVLFMSKSMLLAGVAAGLVITVTYLYTMFRIGRRLSVFERQLVDALGLAARSLRAGHPLLGAFQLIADDLDDPIKTIFVEICQQQEMGVGLDVALKKASDDLHSPDMKLFATSVGIQLRSGGNLADMMDRVSLVIRERIRLSRRVRVLTAQTQFSKWVLLGLPFVLFLLLSIIRPTYIETLYVTQNGRYLLAAAGLGLLMGAWVMNRMAKITW